MPAASVAAPRGPPAAPPRSLAGGRAAAGASRRPPARDCAAGSSKGRKRGSGTSFGFSGGELVVERRGGGGGAGGGGNPGRATPPAPRRGGRGSRRARTAPDPRPDPGWRDTELGCEHYGRCSGCTLSEGLGTPETVRRAAEHFAAMGVPFEAEHGEGRGWRARARLAVRAGPGGAADVGLFRRGSHEVLPVPACAAHHPRINAAAEGVRESLAATGCRGYDEGTGEGDLRYLQLTAAAWAAVRPPGGAPAGGTWETAAPGPGVEARPWAAAPGDCSVEVVLVMNGRPGSPGDRARAEALARDVWARLGPSGAGAGGGAPVACSVWVNWQPGRTNTILGPDWTHLHGADLAVADLGGDGPVFFHPGAFMQANPAMAARAVAAMRAEAAGAREVLDLYAGVGALGLSVAPPGAGLTCVEVTPAALAPFARSAARRPGRSAMRVASASERPEEWVAGGWDVAIVDPPRRGLGDAALAALCRAAPPAPGAPPRRLLYLSCGFPALQRDLAALAGGGWAVERARGFVFFPGADHLETLVVLRRGGAGPGPGAAAGG